MWPGGSDGNGDGGGERYCDGVRTLLPVPSSLSPGLESFLCRLLLRELE